MIVARALHTHQNETILNFIPVRFLRSKYQDSYQMAKKSFCQEAREFFLTFFLSGRTNFGHPAPQTHIFDRRNFWSTKKPENTKNFQNFTQNDPNFQVCLWGVNTRSKHFSDFFPKTIGLKENFGLKNFSLRPPHLGAPRWQKDENSDFRPKMSFGRSFCTPQNMPSRGGVAEKILARTKKKCKKN